MGDSSIDSPTYPMAQLTVRYGSHGPVSSLIYLKITYEKWVMFIRFSVCLPEKRG